MWKARTRVLAVSLTLGTLCLPIPHADAGSAPEIVSVMEARDAQTGGVVLLVAGKGVSRFREFSLSAIGGAEAGEVELVAKSSTMLSLRLPPSVQVGNYDLTLTYSRSKSETVRVSLAAGAVPPGSLTGAALNAGLRSDLDDAVTLGGVAASSYARSADVVQRTGSTMTGALVVNTVVSTAIDASTSAGGSRAVVGRNSAATGVGVAVQGESASTSGTAVYGVSTASTGDTVGVLGEVRSVSGIGMIGHATAASGGTIGVQGQSDSTSGTGVLGVATSASGSVFGVRGLSSSPSSVAVSGESSATTGDAIGVGGLATSPDGMAVAGYATSTSGTNHGVRGITESSEGNGVTGQALSTTGIAWGVHGESASEDGTGVVGDALSATGLAVGVSGSSKSSDGVGVLGVGEAVTGSAIGVFGICAAPSGTGTYGWSTATSGSARGLFGVSESSAGIALAAEARGSGAGSVALLADHRGSVGTIALFQSSGSNVARIDKSGRGYFNGGTQTSGADFAESVAVREPLATLEPGDVIAIDPEGVRRFTLCREANSSAVAGIYSTRPGILARPGDVAGLDDPTRGELPLAVTGIVPCKVCDEGGVIRAGDLLVSASLPGYAKRAPANPAAGTVLAKALGALAAGTGTIEVLITMR